MKDLVLMGVFLGAVGLYYGVLVRIGDRSALHYALRWLPASAHSVTDVFSVVNIVVAGIFQAALVAVLLGWVPWTGLPRFWEGLHPLHLLLAVPLALVELASSAAICGVVIALLRQRAGQPMDWRAMMESGWVRSFMRAGAFLPKGSVPLLFVAYLGCEEILFRGIGLAAFSPWGEPAAVILSSLAFIAIQAVGMPSLMHALFPITGALVMGPVHAILAVQGVPIIVLIIAHTLFFFTALATAPHLESAAPRGQVA